MPFFFARNDIRAEVQEPSEYVKIKYHALRYLYSVGSVTEEEWLINECEKIISQEYTHVVFHLSSTSDDQEFQCNPDNLSIIAEHLLSKNHELRELSFIRFDEDIFERETYGISMSDKNNPDVIAIDAHIIPAIQANTLHLEKASINGSIFYGEDKSRSCVMM